ncbi:MAG TPA: hypothetical protein VIL85_00015 [Thermomicrobiales bacterium]|jgi:hypothetical protein
MARRRVTLQPSDRVGGPIAIMQILQRTWTKAARGAPLAAQRRRLPDALPLPRVLLGEPPPRYLVQRAEFTATIPFGEPSRLTIRQETTAAPRRFDNIEIRPLLGALQVNLRWAWGAPWRWSRHGLFTLRPGTWGRVEYNYRSGGDEAWTYAHYVINIALTSTPTARLFLDSAPDHRYRDLARLW